MSEDQTKELRRLSNLVSKIAELAEHVEQTGSFTDGALNSVKRYNVVVERLEIIEAVPAGMFPKLEENTSFGQLGAEATLLASYLKDMVDEDAEQASPPSSKGPDLGPLVALAPFLGSRELSQLVRERFPKAKLAGEEDEEVTGYSGPNLKTIVSLAPHMKSSDLADVLRTYIAAHGSIDPKYLTALAPHLHSEQLSEMMRASAPEWFKPKSKAEPQPDPKANVVSTPEARTDWMKDLNDSKPE